MAIPLVDVRAHDAAPCAEVQRRLGEVVKCAHAVAAALPVAAVGTPS